MATSNASHLSQTNEWATPSEYLEAVRSVLGVIELDPCAGDEANKAHVGALTAYDIHDDGLSRDWKGRVFLNPPYSKGLAKLFTDKLITHYRSGDIPEAIALLSLSHMSTKWFQPVYQNVASLCIPRKRITFIPMTRQKDSKSPAAGSVFLYFGSNQLSFSARFAQHGPILQVTRALTPLEADTIQHNNETGNASPKAQAEE